MNILPESIRVLTSVIAAFERLQIPYFVGGSLASTLYGVARSTLDTDIVADIHLDQANELITALGKEFYADDEMICSAIEQESSFYLIHYQTMFKIDVFIRKGRPFDRMQFQRRVEQVLTASFDQKAFFSTAEDIILAKLEWYRQDNETSDRQWRDILGVLKVQAGHQDIDYLHTWAAELNITDMLERALKESE